MPANAKMKNLRLQAQLSQNQLARAANLDRGTISAAENGRAVQELSRAKIAAALSTALGRRIEADSMF